jgi:hypothetical protein
MQQTRREVIDAFLAFVTESRDSIARVIAEDVCNRALEHVWLKHPWQAFTSPHPFVFQTVARRDSFSLPSYFGRLGPGRVRNLTTGRELRVMLADDLERADPTAGIPLTSGGIPFAQPGPIGMPAAYLLGGTQGVERQPPPDASTPLEVVSTDSADTDVLVTVRGRDAQGQQRHLTVALTGSAPVAVGSWTWVDEFSKAYNTSVTPGDTTGTVKSSTSRGTVSLQLAIPPPTPPDVLSTLFDVESSRSYLQITLYPMPDGPYVIAVPTIRAARKLVSDADPLPPFWGPAVFEEMIVQWRVNTGELGLDANIPRPALMDLIAFDNEQRSPRGTVPFGIGGASR